MSSSGLELHAISQAAVPQAVEDDATPLDFICPITLERMRNPVMCADGHTYERYAIERWLSDKSTSPLSGALLEDTSVTPNHALRSAIEAWHTQHFRELRQSDLVVGRRIGSGSFNAVFEATLVQRVRGRPDGHKKVAAAKQRRADEAATMDEVKLLVKLSSHPNIVYFIGICRATADEPCYIITDFAPHGSLSQLMEREGGLPIEHTRNALRQICNGMEALANASIVHRDLAARNVFVFEYASADASVLAIKVGDFNLSIDTYMATHVEHAPVAIPFRWMPPEALQKLWFSEKSDVWAFAVTAWELLTGGNVPYWELDESVVKREVVAGRLRLARPGVCSDDALWELLECCWCDDRKKRPTFARIAALLPAAPSIPPLIVADFENIKRVSPHRISAKLKVTPQQTKEIERIAATRMAKAIADWLHGVRASMDVDAPLPPAPRGAVVGVRIAGHAGKLQKYLGIYALNVQYSPKADFTQVYTLVNNSDVHLYRTENGWWHVNNTASMLAGTSNEAVFVSTTTGPSPLALSWRQPFSFFALPIKVSNMSADELRSCRAESCQRSQPWTAERTLFSASLPGATPDIADPSWTMVEHRIVGSESSSMDSADGGESAVVGAAREHRAL